MKKFVLEYHGSDIAKNPTQEERKASGEKWMTWFGSFQNHLVDSGNPFAPEGKSVSSRSVDTVSADMMPSTGYTIINAESMDEAIEVAKGCPLVESATGSVRVYEAMPM